MNQRAPMTIGELIAGLSHFSLDTRVVVTAAHLDKEDFDVIVDVTDQPNTVELRIQGLK